MFQLTLSICDELRWELHPALAVVSWVWLLTADKKASLEADTK